MIAKFPCHAVFGHNTQPDLVGDGSEPGPCLRHILGQPRKIVGDRPLLHHQVGDPENSDSPPAPHCRVRPASACDKRDGFLVRMPVLAARGAMGDALAARRPRPGRSQHHAGRTVATTSLSANADLPERAPPRTRTAPGEKPVMSGRLDPAIVDHAVTTQNDPR